ncbi:unnamed protein product [Porites lobata]|uniref:P-type ATPase C-terminal domain-containing protein n=1 Tax=Porites lobata TaxID=104759 RepID=A0ABN8RIY3_9CNID|nr:unnamed protein product [Porites lobata]
MLRNAGIRIWMLTGDKLETATCIAQSSRLIARNQMIHTFKQISNRSEAHLELNSLRRKNDCALIIKGDSLEVCLRHYEQEFIELACNCPVVVCCRCSPQQKADIVTLLKKHTGKRTCAIGDGGNDVSMIQAADAGVGIEGKEGRQASLAADFSITQFRYLGRLLMWHGRNSDDGGDDADNGSLSNDETATMTNDDDHDGGDELWQLHFLCFDGKNFHLTKFVLLPFVFSFQLQEISSSGPVCYPQDLLFP